MWAYIVGEMKRKEQKGITDIGRIGEWTRWVLVILYAERTKKGEHTRRKGIPFNY